MTKFLLTNAFRDVDNPGGVLLIGLITAGTPVIKPGSWITLENVTVQITAAEVIRFDNIVLTIRPEEMQNIQASGIRLAALYNTEVTIQ